MLLSSGWFDVQPFAEHFADQVNGEGTSKHSEKSTTLLGSAAINYALANKIVSNILFLFWGHCLNKSVELYIVRPVTVFQEFP